MKTLFTLLLSLFISTATLAQEKPDAVVGQSQVTKKDKLVESFVLGKKKYNVYLSETTIDPLEGNDAIVIQLYKIVPDKRKYSDLEFPKLNTQNGKITGESAYKVINNTLVVTNDSYDYIGAYRTIEVYVPYKYGLKKISEKMVAIDTDKLPDSYLKPAEMKQPSKN